MFRSKKLLAAAQGQNCTICLDGVCNGNPLTVVAAHSNYSEHGKGMQIKAHDCYIAWACSACHHAIDQGSRLSYDQKKDAWTRGFERTLLAMWEQNMLTCK